MALSGWCATRGRPDCARCRSERCGHECHGANPAQPPSQKSGAARGKIGAQSGPESALTDRGLPITQAKDVTG